MFCGCHRLQGMVGVVNKTCEVEGCHKRPSLNYPGVRPAIRCGAHKLAGMTNSFRKLDSSVLSGELKEKAEESKKRPKRRGEMIKVQRNIMKAKIFSAIMNEELSREGQPLSKSPPNYVHTKTNHAAAQSTASSAPHAQPNPFAPPRFSVPSPFFASILNVPNLPILHYGAQFQPGSSPMLSCTHTGAFMSREFAAACGANVNVFSGNLQSMEDLEHKAPDYIPKFFPGVHQLRFNQCNQFNQFNPAFFSGFQPQTQQNQNGKPSPYSNPIPPIFGCMQQLPIACEEGANEIDPSLFSVASSMSHDKAFGSSKRQKIEDGTRGKIAELLHRTSEEKCGGAFASVAGRSFRPIVERATQMTLG